VAPSAAGRVVCRFPAVVEGVRRGMAWRRASGRLWVQMSAVGGNDGALPAYGDRCRFSGPMFDGRLSRRRGMSGEMRARPDTWRRLSSGHRNPVLRGCAAGRRSCRAVLRRGLDAFPAEAAVYESLVLGYRESIPDDVNETFRATGTLHIFAISGLHVTMVVSLLALGVRATGWSKRWWGLALIPALAVYTGATGMAPSAVRACAMASCYWAALLVSRRPDLASSIALAAVSILVPDPRTLYDPGFIYSFAIVAGLIVLYPPVARSVSRRIETDPWRWPSAERLPRRMLRHAVRYVALLLVTSWCALVVSLPLTACFANLVSPGGLVGNLAAIPASFLIVLAGALSLVAGAMSDAGAEIFNHAARAITVALIATMRALESVPGAQWAVRSPPVLALAVYYVWLAGAVLFPGRPRRVLFGIGAAAAAVLAAAGLVDRRAEVEWGGGLAPTAWVNGPGGGDALIDPGPAWRAGRVVRFLRARGVDRLRAVVVTRPLEECAGALPAVLRSIPADEIWCPAASARSAPYRRALAEARAGGYVVREMTRGDRIALSGGVAIEALDSPRGGACRDAAPASLILRISGPRRAVLWPAPAADGGTPAARDALAGADRTGDGGAIVRLDRDEDAAR